MIFKSVEMSLNIQCVRIFKTENIGNYKLGSQQNKLHNLFIFVVNVVNKIAYNWQSM